MAGHISNKQGAGVVTRAVATLRHTGMGQLHRASATGSVEQDSTVRTVGQAPGSNQPHNRYSRGTSSSTTTEVHHGAHNQQSLLRTTTSGNTTSSTSKGGNRWRSSSSIKQQHDDKQPTIPFAISVRQSDAARPGNGHAERHKTAITDMSSSSGQHTINKFAESHMWDKELRHFKVPVPEAMCTPLTHDKRTVATHNALPTTARVTVFNSCTLPSFSWSPPHCRPGCCFCW